jgi:hypothetical protein
VGDHHGGHAEFVGDLPQEPDNLFAPRVVQRLCRFVHEEHGGASHQGAGNVHALTLAAGQLVRAFAADRSEPDNLQKFRRPLAGGGLRVLVGYVDGDDAVFNEYSFRGMYEQLRTDSVAAEGGQGVHATSTASSAWTNRTAAISVATQRRIIRPA